MDAKTLQDTVITIAKMGGMKALEQLAKEVQIQETQNVKYEGDLGKMAYELGRIQGRTEGIEIYISRLQELTNV
jgi:hypothetical protein